MLCCGLLINKSIVLYPLIIILIATMVRAATLFAGLAGLAGIVSAHPGHDVKAEAAERAAFLKNSPVQARGLRECDTKLKARGLENSNVARRQRAVENLRRKRGLVSSMWYPSVFRSSGIVLTTWF